MAGARNDLVLREDLPVVIEDRDDAGVAPEVGDGDLQTVEIGTVAADALRLGVSEPQVLQGGCRSDRRSETLHGSVDVGPHRAALERAEAVAADRQRVGVILQLGVVGPSLAAIALPQ